MSAIEPRYCPTCGEALDAQRFDGRERAYCAACDEHIFHLPSPAAGVAVVRNGEILLIHRIGRQHGGTWAMPGGLIEWDEQPSEAAVRELAEETGVEAAAEDLTLIDATRIEGPRGEFSCIKLNYAISYVATSGGPSPGEDVQDAQFWTLGRIDQSTEELRPGERTWIKQALDWESESR